MYAGRKAGRATPRRFRVGGCVYQDADAVVAERGQCIDTGLGAGVPGRVRQQASAVERIEPLRIAQPQSRIGGINKPESLAQMRTLPFRKALKHRESHRPAA